MLRCVYAAPICFLLFLSPLAHAEAEERFYPIVDADGRIRNISLPAEKGVKKGGADDAAPLEPLVEDDAREAVPSVRQEPGLVQGGGKVKEKKDTTHAPYGSDVYLDSEVLDSTDFNPEQKKNFYIIPDGSGTRIEQSEAGPADAPVALEAPVKPRRLATELLERLIQISDQDELKSLLGNAFCLPENKAGRAVGVVKGRWENVFIDKKTLSIVGPREVISAYRVDGEGMRLIKLRSYANSTRSPSFARPYIVLAGANGCAARVLTTYYQKRYPATESQHAMVEAEITMHAEEKFLLIVVPDMSGRSDPADYQLSQYGQLGIKWQP